jgi:hypothetical protein
MYGFIDPGGNAVAVIPEMTSINVAMRIASAAATTVNMKAEGICFGSSTGTSPRLP